MNQANIRLLASILSIAGSLLLAFRVTGILKALAAIAHIHETNILELSKPDSAGSRFIFTNSHKLAEKAKRQTLLILGFALIVVSALLQAAILLGLLPLK